ncbi:MAG: glucoamylase family protein [Pandoraea sp.]|nr:glucoamylase family protein [Pandoraea sp.]MDR3397441.1 glucoamylase family protein [Pandoraea sp.]
MSLTMEGDLLSLQAETFGYFLHESDDVTGLVIDKTQPGWPASIAATGLALACYPVGVERGLMSRAAAVERTLKTLKFFWNSPQGPEPDATGYHGFYYHFLDMRSGRRVWQCELSTVDTTFLLAGMLTAGVYFDGQTDDEKAIRELAEALYQRADWTWFQNGGETLSHGWRPENGFIPYRWEGYDEALLLYILGLASPTHPLPPSSYTAWASTYEWKHCYGFDYLYAGPLFTHQLSHIWIDFRGVQDAAMRAWNMDYFENSRRATYVQRQYGIVNPLQYDGYGECCWGITASDGPGPALVKIDGVNRKFYDYLGRGVPFGPDDGTLAPWAVVASLPFAPEIVLPVMEHFLHGAKLTKSNPYGFKSTFNMTYPDPRGSVGGWTSPWHYGLNQGPIVLMIENHLSGFPWKLMRHCPYITKGLLQAGFQGGSL